MEALLIAAGYWAYDAVRDFASLDREHAVADGNALYAVEHALGLAHEHAVNSTFAAAGWLTTLGNYWYAILHLGVTATTLTWLYAVRPHRYRSARSLLVLTSLIAFVVFWLFPVAPPRLLPGAGFIDTVSLHDTFGSYETGSLAGAADLYAAMPSLHVAWALWVALMVRRAARRPWARRLVLVYPVLTAVDVVATANHYIADVLAAGVLLAVSMLVQHLCHRWRSGASVTGQGGTAAEAPEPEPVDCAERVA